MEEASSIQCLNRQAFTMERWEEKLPTCHLAGFLEAKPPHVWVILTVLRLKGATHQMNSNDLSGGIEPLASFCDSVIQ